VEKEKEEDELKINIIRINIIRSNMIVDVDKHTVIRRLSLKHSTKNHRTTIASTVDFNFVLIATANDNDNVIR
jgi:hypothetical protein